MMNKGLRQRVALAITGAVTAVALSGCGVFSDETEAKGKEALCASTDASVESLKAGGSGAKAVASIIYDLTDDAAVKDAATKVRDGDMDELAVETLTSWVSKVC